MNLIFRKIIGGLVATAFFSTQVVVASPTTSTVWNERKNVLTASLPLSLLPQISSVGLQSLPQKQVVKSTPLGELISAVPLSEGTIRDISDQGTSNPVLLIQDVHMNPEAQNHIAATLKNLIEQEKTSFVGVEGAFTDFDFERFRVFPNQEIKEKIARAYLDLNLIGAPSYTGITSIKEPPLFSGIDDADHYQANVDALLEANNNRSRVELNIAQQKQFLAEQKEKHFSPSLISFDHHRESYRNGKMGVGIYIEYLGRNLSALPKNSERFLAAYKLEQSLNFSHVEQQRNKLLHRLTSRIDDRGLSLLLAKSLDFRDGRIGFGAYYIYLKDLCARHEINLNEFPDMKAYIEYSLLAAGVDAGHLQDDMSMMEQQTLSKLKLSEKEKELLEQNEANYLSNKLVRLELTPPEWAQYKQVGGEFSSFEAFYREADIRSERMVENLLSKDVTEKGSVLIAGGFHTPLLKKSLKDRGISYAVFTPRLTKIDKDGSTAYLSIFSREKSDLNKLLSGEKLFLAPPHLPVGTRATDTLESDVTMRARLATVTPWNFSHDEVRAPPASGVVVTAQTEDVTRVTVDDVALEVKAGEGKEAVAGTVVKPTKNTALRIYSWRWLRPIRIRLARLIDRDRQARLAQEERRGNQARRSLELDPLTGVAIASAFDRAIENLDPDTTILLINSFNSALLNKDPDLGINAGNKIIQETAFSIIQGVTPNNRIFRVSGGKFAVLVPKNDAVNMQKKVEEIFGVQVIKGIPIFLFGAIGETRDEAEANLGRMKIDVTNHGVNRQITRQREASEFNITTELVIPSQVESEPSAIKRRFPIWLADTLDPSGKVKLIRSKLQRNEAARRAEIDPLTGFGNQTAWAAARGNAENTAGWRIIFFDVNSLGKYDLSQGGPAADLMVSRVAADIRHAAKLNNNERLFRLGEKSDEFLVIARVETAEKILKMAQEFFGAYPFIDKDGNRQILSLTGAIGQTLEEANYILPDLKVKRKAELLAKGADSAALVLPLWKLIFGQKIFESPIFRVVAAPILELPFLPGIAFVLEPVTGLLGAIFIGSLLFALMHGLPPFVGRSPPANLSQESTIFKIRFIVSASITLAALTLSERLQIDNLLPTVLIALFLHMIWILIDSYPENSKLSSQTESVAAASTPNEVKRNTDGTENKLDTLLSFQTLPENYGEKIELLMRVARETALDLGIGKFNEASITLDQWGLITDTWAYRLSVATIDNDEAATLWRNFCSTLRAKLTNESHDKNLIAASFAAIVQETTRFAGEKSETIPQNILGYQILNTGSSNEAIKQVKKALTPLGSQETVHVRHGVVVKNSTVLNALAKKFSKQINSGQLHLILWEDEMKLTDLQKASRLALTKTRHTLSERQAASFFETARYQLFIAEGMDLRTDFMAGMDINRIECYVILAESLMAIQFSPTRMDDLRRLTELLGRQA